MQKRTILFFVIITYAGLSANQYFDKSHQYISCNSQNQLSELEFNLPEFTIENIEVEGINFSRINLEADGEYALPGYPETPCFSTLVAVPHRGSIILEITGLEQTEMDDIIVFPRQSLQSESQPTTREFVIDNDVYQGDDLYPLVSAECSEPVIMRDYRLVRLTFNPFQYDPLNRSLIVNNQIRVQITANGEPGINEITRIRKPSGAFEKLYSNSIINYQNITREEEFQHPSILYIYYNNSTVEDYLQYLVDWRRQKGFEVNVVSTSTIGNNTASIHNYIQDAYDEWDNPPEYVCLVGDANGSFSIPCYYVDTGETDNNFVMLDGSDILPDAAIGRIPFGNTSELATIITKILNYETDPYTGNTAWFQRGLMVGDPSTSGTTCVDTKMYVSDMMAITAPNVEAIGVYSGSCATAIANNLNQGCVYFNYRGFGDFSGWSTNAINNLNNGWMMPVVVFLTCGTGSYASYNDCMSERFVKVGSTTNPKGAVAAISTATNMTHTTFNNVMDAGIWTGLFVDETWNMGMGLCRGKLNIFTNFPNNPSNHQHQFVAWNNLMGDPAMDIWSDTPSEFEINAAALINPELSEYEVQVYSEGQPVESAWVTLLDEEDNSVSVYTETSGSAWLSLEELTEGEITLTVSKHNFIPSQETVVLSSQNGYIDMSMLLIDSETGNGNGLAEPGESIELEISLVNNYQSSFSDLQLMASSITPGIVFDVDFIDINSLAAGDTLVCSDHLSLMLPDNITGIEELIIDFSLSNDENQWSSRLNEIVYAPCLMLNEFELSVGQLDPGENSDLIVYLLNAGTASASNVNLELVSSDPKLDVVESTAFCGMVPPGSAGNNLANPFHVIAEAEIIPGSQIELIINVTSPELQHPPISFLITVGESGVGDPLGPDAGGYFCYDEYDTGYLDCPQYNWQEIDPDYGGDGTIINLYDNGNTGDVAVIDIPVNFIFYGISYDEITVCSNGWIAPGTTGISDFMNTILPGPGGPSPMIAVFWDDLKTSSGNVCYYHDQQEHTFIVEWSHLTNEYSNSNESFQVVIYDSDHYPTSNDNSSLLFQYNDFNNNDLGSYGGFYVYHGQFATIGLEDHTGTSGLQYTYNNTYPIQAEVLEDNSAIFFTSAPIPHDDAYPVLFENEILDSGNDGRIDYGESAEIKISISNIGEQPATEITAVAEINDEFVTLINNTAEYPDISGGDNSYPESGFSIEVADNCPDAHQLYMIVNIYYNGISRDQSRSFVINAPVLENGFLFVINDDNDNQMADPGENFELGLTFNNTGGAPIYNPEVAIVSLDPDLILLPALNQLPIINRLSQSYIILPASLTENVEPGDYISIIVSITGDFGYVEDVNFDLSVGLATEDFETGDFSKFPWETGGAADFVISSLAHNGDYSAQSGDIDDYQNTWLQIDIDTPQSSEVSFWIKVSSENGWDYVCFLIDGEEIDEWSGEISWQHNTYDLDAGQHTLTWLYDKDAIYSSGSDCFWLDDINFPSACSDVPQAVLLDTAEFCFVLEDEQTDSADLGLINIAQVLTSYEFRIEDDDVTWLSVIPTSGFLPPGETTYINLICEPEGLETGEYSAQLCLCDGFNHDTVIPVNLSYTSNSDNNNELPAVTEFIGNYPNPFNPSTTFAFQLADNDRILLDIYNIKGQKVRSLMNSNFDAGFHKIEWDGKNDQAEQLSSGIYFSHFQCSTFSQVHKVLLLK